MSAAFIVRAAPSPIPPPAARTTATASAASASAVAIRSSRGLRFAAWKASRSVAPASAVTITCWTAPGSMVP
jgi:hypothetical protein